MISPRLLFRSRRRFGSIRRHTQSAHGCAYKFNTTLKIRLPDRYEVPLFVSQSCFCAFDGSVKIGLVEISEGRVRTKLIERSQNLLRGENVCARVIMGNMRLDECTQTTCDANLFTAECLLPGPVVEKGERVCAILGAIGSASSTADGWAG